jgi:hypothetical protein
MMALQTATTSTATAKSGGRQILITACSVALAVAVGIGVWRNVERQESAPATVAEGVGSLAARSRPALGATALDSTGAVYIVGSQAEAARVVDAIEEANRHRVQFGERHMNAEVVVVTSVEEEAAVRWAHDEADAIRAREGLEPIALIDLRGR